MMLALLSIVFSLICAGYSQQDISDESYIMSPQDPFIKLGDQYWPLQTIHQYYGQVRRSSNPIPCPQRRTPDKEEWIPTFTSKVIKPIVNYDNDEFKPQSLTDERDGSRHNMGPVLDVKKSLKKFVNKFRDDVDELDVRVRESKNGSPEVSELSDVQSEALFQSPNDDSNVDRKADSLEDNIEESKENSNEYSNKDNKEDSNEESNEDIKEASKEDYRGGNNKEIEGDSREGSEENSDEDSREGSEEDSERDSREGSKEDSKRDSREGSEEDSREDNTDSKGSTRKGSKEDIDTHRKETSGDDSDENTDEDDNENKNVHTNNVMNDFKKISDIDMNVVKDSEINEEVMEIESKELDNNNDGYGGEVATQVKVVKPRVKCDASKPLVGEIEKDLGSMKSFRRFMTNSIDENDSVDSKKPVSKSSQINNLDKDSKKNFILDSQQKSDDQDFDIDEMARGGFGANNLGAAGQPNQLNLPIYNTVNLLARGPDNVDSQLLEPTKGAGISDLSETPVMLVKNKRVCYACSTASNPTCWTPDRKTTVKYCSKEHNSCVTKTFGEGSTLTLVRDCANTCSDAYIPGFTPKYKSCSVCHSDLCNGAFSINNQNLLFAFLLLFAVKSLNLKI